MTHKIYVGNFPYDVNEQMLEELFAPYGTIESVAVIKDRDTGRSKGFGFITFSSENAATAALEKSGYMLGDPARPLKVDKAEERPARGGSDRDRGGRGGRGGY